MKIITCASYFGTGSSAVTNFYSECEGVASLGESEFRFIQDPHGISDLEYNLVENNHRHNTSNAIKEYVKYVTILSNPLCFDRYKKAFGDAFYKLSMEYVDSLTELKAKSWWHQDQINKGAAFCFADRCYSYLRRVLSGKRKKSPRIYSMLREKEYGYYSSITEEEFLEKTRKYLHKLFLSANMEQAEYLMVDQLLPPSNTKRYTRYFSDDLKIIAVDRDPRDVYLWEKEKFQWGVVPAESVEEFVEWYKITRKHRATEIDDPQKVLRVQFEDLIYRYDEMKKVLLDFAEMSPEAHKHPRTYLIPEQSIKGTNLKHKYPQYAEDIKVIERELSEYLYDFERYQGGNIE